MMLLTVTLNMSAQRTQQFGKFTDTNGKTITGTSMERGYERQINIDDLQVNISDVIRIQITIPTSPAVHSFENAVSTKSSLRSGEITVLKQIEDRKIISQIILMNNIRVLSVNISDEQASITLEAESYDQTFYEHERNGHVKAVKK